MAVSRYTHKYNDKKQRQNDTKHAAIMILSYYYLETAKKNYHKHTMTNAVVSLICYYIFLLTEPNETW